VKLDTPILTSKRLILKKIDSTYSSQKYVDSMNDSSIVQYLESGGNYTLEKLDEFLKNIEHSSIFFWAISIKDNGKHIGNIKIHPINFKHGIGEYSILMVDKFEWGKGYAKEASILVINYCFETLKLRKIILGVVEDNQNAIELYLKLGFHVEGIYKKHGIYNAKLCDIYRMALFNTNHEFSK